MKRLRSWKRIAPVWFVLSACSLQDFDGFGAGDGGLGGISTHSTAGSTNVTVAGAGGGWGGSASSGGTSAGGSGGTGVSGGGQGGSGTEEWQPLEVEPVPENALISDASFEDGTAGWLPVGDAVLEHSDDRPHSGQYHLRVRGRRDYWQGPGYSLLGVAEADGVYLLSVWVRSIESVAQNLTLRYTCTGESTRYTQLGAGQASTSWTQLQATMIVPGCQLTDLTFLLDSPLSAPVYDFDVDDVYLIPDPSQQPTQPPPPPPDAGAPGDAGTSDDAGTDADASSGTDAGGGS